MSLGVGRLRECQDLAPASESCSFLQAWIPLWAFPAIWAQGDRLSTAATPRCIRPSLFAQSGSALGRGRLADFSGGVRGSCCLWAQSEQWRPNSWRPLQPELCAAEV